MMYETTPVPVCEKCQEQEGKVFTEHFFNCNLFFIEEQHRRKVDKFEARMKIVIDRKKALIQENEIASRRQWQVDKAYNLKAKQAWKDLKAKGLTQPDILHPVLQSKL